MTDREARVTAPSERDKHLARRVVEEALDHYQPECYCADGDPDCPVYGFVSWRESFIHGLAQTLAAARDEARREQIEACADLLDALIEDDSFGVDTGRLWRNGARREAAKALRSKL